MDRVQMRASVKRYLVAIIGGLLLMAGSQTHAMEFDFRPVKFTSGETQTFVVASGEIRRGDAQRLRQYLAANRSWWTANGNRGGKAAILLDSPGGDVDEAIKLAQVLRESLATAIAVPPAVCASACFFLYVGAAKRMGYAEGPGGGLAIHRPFFSADVTRQMSVKDAQVAHDAAFTRAKRWLQDQLVPQALIDKMLSLPSTNAYWLTDTDINSLGFRAPWYEEWLLARCPEYVKVQRRLLATTSGTSASEEAEREFRDQRKCENQAEGPEMEAMLARYAKEFARQK